MATDIAFSLGVLALLGSRVPITVKIFLTTLAIVDDMGAVLVIAIFYSHGIDWTMLGGVGAMFAILIGFNLFGVRALGAYSVVGLVMWYFMLKSGVHATIAGLLMAVAIPMWTGIDLSTLQRRVVDRVHPIDGLEPTHHERTGGLAEIARQCEQAQLPLQRMEHALHPWVGFVIMPVFALANAGVRLEEGILQPLMSPIAFGIVAGLLIGKPLGIVAACWLAVRTGLAKLPRGVRWAQLVGVGFLGGIGFAMSLFVAGLAFGDSRLETAKVGILIGSLLAGVIGTILLRRTPVPKSALAE